MIPTVTREQFRKAVFAGIMAARPCISFDKWAALIAVSATATKISVGTFHSCPAAHVGGGLDSSFPGEMVFAVGYDAAMRGILGDCNFVGFVNIA
jgi:hypothetical protein